MVRHVGHDTYPTEGGSFLVRFPMTFLAMVSCPLSLRERVRVRGFCPYAMGSLTPALCRWERAREAPPDHAQRCYLTLH